MAIKLGGNTNITLTNTSFVGDVYPGKKSVPLFTAASNGTYYFEGDIQDSGTIAVSLNINSAPKEIWTYYDSVSHHVSYEFTLVTGDVVEIEVSGYGTGSNLTVTRYADEPKEIYVGEGTLVYDYSAMRGPAPTGYHVPLSTERQAVHNIRTVLGGGSLDGTNFGIALKLPLTGTRSYSSSGISNQGTYGFYWSSSRYNSTRAYYLYLSSSVITPQSNSPCANGFSVRCFKDSPTIPTSSWTKLYGTSIEAGGIFWSSTDGLISLSSDGQTWITIADKNLGATTVWNSGDTLSEANCGKYYQWGNNYGFLRTGTITTSSTKVDTTNYGPGNYYNSSTFITGSTDWSNVQNDNLRGGVTGVQQRQIGNVKEVYVGTTKVRPNAETYIIDLTESYSNTIPAGDTINKVKILLDDITAPSAFISIGSGNNGLSFVGSGMGMPGGAWINISTSDLSGTIEYDFNTSVVSFDLTGGGNHQSGSQQFSYWTIDESIDELISYTISQWGDPSYGTVKISIERDTSNTSTNQGQQSGGGGQGENNGGNR